MKKTIILAILFILVIWNLASSEENQQNSEREVYQLEEISVTPGRFSISERALSPYLIPKT